MFKSLLLTFLAGWRSELAGCRSTFSMSKIKVKGYLKQSFAPFTRPWSCYSSTDSQCSNDNANSGKKSILLLPIYIFSIFEDQVLSCVWIGHLKIYEVNFHHLSFFHKKKSNYSTMHFIEFTTMCIQIFRYKI